MPTQPQNRQFKQLREAAEQALEKVRGSTIALHPSELETALQKLQVHQIELEMQNDELFIANEQIELQRIKFEHIYDLAPVGYFILNKKGIVEDVNTAGMKLLNTSRAVICGRSLISFVAREQTNDFNVFYHRLLTDEDKHSCHIQFLSKAGREFYALLEGRRVDTYGTCYIAMADITESVEVRRRLVETNDRLKLALEASAAGTWELHFPSMRFVLDDRNQQLCNAQAGGFSGTYQSFIGLVHPDDRFRVDQHFRTAIHRESEIDVAACFFNSTGEVRHASIRGHLVREEMISLEKRFTGIIWDITEEKRLEELAQQEEQQRQKDIAMAALRAQEKERKRISEALHDSVSQLLYGIKIHLAQLNDENRETGKKKLDELLDMAIRETRNMSFELAPPTLADFGLAATIKELCQRLSTPAMKITATVIGFSNGGDLLLEVTIFRIVQELINNCMKHSGAAHIQVQVKQGKLTTITVIDDGKGFSIKETERKTHGTGLASIRNRLSLYNGKIEVQSAPQKGTTVKISLEV